jgi:hypothetical protein
MKNLIATIETLDIYGCQLIEESVYQLNVDAQMSAFAIGTQVQLLFQTQFLTFTPDQFGKALKDRSFLEVRSQMPNPANPQMPISIQSFSKDNMTVMLLPPNPPDQSPIVLFQVLNTINLEQKYKEIKEILVSLNIYPEIIASSRFKCTTRTKAKTNPKDRLTSLVEPTFLKKMSENLSKELKVFSIRFASDIPLGREGGCQVIIEPLATNPNAEYYVEISYIALDIGEFDKFISEFGSDMIKRIMEENK